MADDRWPQLLDLAAQDRGTIVRDCGQWTESKLFFWSRYVDIAVSAMSQHPRWNGVSYVDLFAGPGICQIRDTGTKLPGSALVAANARHAFVSIEAVELDPANAAALTQRLASSPASHSFNVTVGDCNAVIKEIVARIPKRSLTLAFVDPPNLDIHFETIRALATGRRADLLILLADSMDIVRNVDLYASGNSAKLDRMFPRDFDWRTPWGALDNRSSENICKLFSDLYKAALRDELGYKFFREKVIGSSRTPLYRLLFASMHELGTKFWDRVTKKDSQGQSELF